MGFTPTAPYTLTTYSASTSSTAAADYKQAIDNNFAVSQRMGTAFAVSEQPVVNSRNMTVHVSAGWLFNGIAFTEVAAQDSTALAVPSGAPRIDRIVGDLATGIISVVGGTEAVVPVAPDIPFGKMPLAQVLLQPEMLSRIGNSMITDERAVWGLAPPGDYQEFLTTGTFSWDRPGGFSTNSVVTVYAVAGGGAGAINGGGGGGAVIAEMALGELSTSVTVIVGVGGTTSGGLSGETSFGPVTVYGGGNCSTVANSIGGGGGGLYSRGTSGGNAGALVGSGGGPRGGLGYNGHDFSPTGDSAYGGGGGGDSGLAVAFGGAGGWTGFGGGGGGGGTGSTNPGPGGKSIYGGGGGGGLGTTPGAGGVSLFGGNGGAGSTSAGNGSAGIAPGGGGGVGAPGAKGWVKVWVQRG